MMSFWIAAAAMVAVALAFVVPPLLRRRAGAVDERRALNVAVHRERLAELEQDRREGQIDEAHYQAAKSELERDLLADVAPEGAAPPARPARAAWRAAVAVTLLVPLLAGAGYWHLGAYPLLDGSAAAQQGPAVETMVAALAARLAEQPDDGMGWALLGRSYMVMGRYDEAVKAYERAQALLGDEPDLLVALAEALSMENGTRLAGRPLALIEQALARDPDHTKGLWLSGAAAYQQGELAAAVGIWERLVGRLPPDSESASVLNNAIVQTRRELAAAGPAAAGPRITVEVDIAEAMRAKTQPDNTVYVFASPEESLGPPAAVARLKVSDLPATVVLDDALAIMPTHKLSGHQSVSVGARISRSGSADWQSGDLRARAQVVAVGAERRVALLIDREHTVD